MAVGTHWEWRAFGVPPLRLLLQARRWKRHCLFDELGNTQVDEYLWCPGVSGNVKIREDSFKFKRLLRREGDCELWAEREEETFEFPLTEEAAEFAAKELSCSPPGVVSGWGTSLKQLKAALPSFDPPVSVIPVRKHRIQYRVESGGSWFLVEFAEVREPRAVFSVAVETNDLGDEEGLVVEEDARTGLARLRGAVEDLGLPGCMEVCGYLQMLDRWGRSG